MRYKIDYFCVSHIGNCRKINQDNFNCLGRIMEIDKYSNGELFGGTAYSENEPMFAVFDGMGGEERGEVASYIATDVLNGTPLINPEKDFNSYCKKANAEICRYTKENRLTSMGTTAAMLKFTRRKIFLCNIGDSKIFRFSDNKLSQISYDHIISSVFGTKPLLTQNLGIEEKEMIISPYIFSLKYKDGDAFLICSDGLTDMVSCSETEELLRCAEKSDAANLLLNKALRNGGKDNITIILIYIQKKKFRLFKKNQDM